MERGVESPKWFELARDPVCGMYVNEEHAAFKVERGGKTYYFCSEGCMLTFQEPDRELK